MSINFDMGGDILATLTTQTGGSVDELVGLVRSLGEADQDFQNAINGNGAISYANFKVRVDECANDLSSVLHAINLGQSEMDKAIQAGDDEMVDNAKADEGSSNFDSARFSSSR